MASKPTGTDGAAIHGQTLRLDAVVKDLGSIAGRVDAMERIVEKNREASAAAFENINRKLDAVARQDADINAKLDLLTGGLTSRVDSHHDALYEPERGLLNRFPVLSALANDLQKSITNIQEEQGAKSRDLIKVWGAVIAAVLGLVGIIVSDLGPIIFEKLLP